MTAPADLPWLVAGDPLLEALRRRTPDALDRLAERWAGPLIKVAWCQLGDVHAADDAVQETLIAAWDAGPSLAADANLRAWLFAVLFNQCRKQQRSFTRWWRRVVAISDRSAPETVEQPLDELQAALAGLEPDLRAVVVLRHLQEIPVAECATILGVPAGTVKSRCHQALSLLRNAIGKERHGL